MLVVLVFGEGAGGGARLELDAVVVLVGTLGWPPVVDVPVGGPGGGRRGEPCGDSEPEVLRFIEDSEATPTDRPPAEPILVTEDLLPDGGPGGGRRGDPCADEVLEPVIPVNDV